MARTAHQLPEQFVRALHIINCTPKAATAFVLADETEITGSELYDRIAEITGEKNRLPRKSAFRNYCDHVLVPQGFATRNVSWYNRKTQIARFSPTETGKLWGFAAASCGLDWEATNECSLAKILGETASPFAIRGPETRFRMLAYLDQVRQAYLDEIARALDINPSILNRHKNALERAGVIACEQQKREKIYVHARVTEKGRNLLDTCLYPLYAAAHSSADLEALYETGLLLHDPELARHTMRKAFASHTLKHNGSVK